MIEIGDLIILHRNLAVSARWLMLLMAFWAAYSAWQRKPLTSLFFGIVTASQLMIIIQSIAGAYFFLGLSWRPVHWIQHLLYGGLLVFTIPTVYYYTRKEDDNCRIAIIWTLACIFMFGLTFRSALTGVMGG